MIRCKDCRYFRLYKSTEDGFCEAPLPAAVQHPGDMFTCGNIAFDCPLFIRKDDMTSLAFPLKEKENG